MAIKRLYFSSPSVIGCSVQMPMIFNLTLSNYLSKPLPIVIMAHGFSATITGMVADHFAEAFYDAGFVVLLYDHRNFGISDGEPRQEINKWVQARGYHDAIDFAATLPEIDATRIALWGDSMSGAEVLVVGSVDQRVKAIIAQVPAFGDSPPPPDPDGVLFAAIRETLLHGDVSGTPETTTARMPVVSFDQASLPSLLLPLTAYRWFIEYGGRYGTKWENWATIVTPATPAPLHPVLCAPHLQAALLLVIAEEDEMEGANSNITNGMELGTPTQGNSRNEGRSLRIIASSKFSFRSGQANTERFSHQTPNEAPPQTDEM